MSLPRENGRLGIAISIAAWTGAVSYGLQHLYAASGPVLAVTPTIDAHIPFYWRMALVALHAGLGGLLAYQLLDEQRGRRLVAWGPWMVLSLLPLAVLMAVFP